MGDGVFIVHPRSADTATVIFSRFYVHTQIYFVHSENTSR